MDKEKDVARLADQEQVDNASLEANNATELQPATEKRDQKFIENGVSYSANHSIQGFKYYLLVFGLLLSLTLVHLEISIVSTSLVSISDDLGQFSRSSWIIAGYLLTYTAFMVILAKLSDLISRKITLILCLTIFTVFSGICGAAQTMVQLIVFRAFQGLGASGVYSLVMVVMFELVPPAQFPTYTAVITGVFCVSFVSGPLIGGAINDNTTWRWIFLINAPGGAIALLCLIYCIPRQFPNRQKTDQGSKIDIGSLDLVGTGSMVVGIMLLIVGLEGASDFTPWKSARVLAPIIISVLGWAIFIWYERLITIRDRPEPVFPWRFCTSRIILATFTNGFLSGGIFTSCVIQIPLRFQNVNNETPFQAGVRLIPFAVLTPVGTMFGAIIAKRLRVPLLYVTPVGAVLQTLGLVFMSRMQFEDISWSGQYGLQGLTAIGVGLTFCGTTLMIPYIIQKRDLATATSGITQARVLGGALVLALITAIMNSDLSNTLRQTLSPTDFSRIFDTVGLADDLPEALRTTVRETFLKGYNKQLRILVGLAGAQVLVSVAQWQKDAVKLG